jgi:hypothetical protein
MRIAIKVGAALGITMAAVACNPSLSGPKLDQDPNTPSTATSNQLLASIGQNANILLNGPAARFSAMWTQQMAGTDRQYQSFGLYQGLTESNYDAIWSAVYTGGGLVDIRNVEAGAQAAGDRTTLGIAEVWEAIFVGTAADLWGDVPYSDISSTQPKLDKQADVYAALQKVLDAAVADLGAGTGAGPGGVDLIYNGDRTKWLAAAHSMKARLFLHTAKANNSAYASALAEAQQGIRSPSGNFLTWSSTVAGEQNIWQQFFINRDSYMRAGKNLVDLMKARNDPRLPQYFGLDGANAYGGAAPGQNLDGFTMSWLSTARGAPDFRQPFITSEDNNLVIAEAQYRGGTAAVALTTLNTERTALGLAALPVTTTGAAVLTAILDEKYVATFQQIEAYNDWRRTCWPNIAPASNTFNGNVPPRFFYASIEITANANIPALGQQPTRNQLDSPAAATAADGTACKGQK